MYGTSRQKSRWLKKKRLSVVTQVCCDRGRTEQGQPPWLRKSSNYSTPQDRNMQVGPTISYSDDETIIWSDSRDLHKEKPPNSTSFLRRNCVFLLVISIISVWRYFLEGTTRWSIPNDIQPCPVIVNKFWVRDLVRVTEKSQIQRLSC